MLAHLRDSRPAA